MSLQVINLQAENYKRLKAVNITPDGNVVFIGGRNAQGKTSVLDAIWAALAGGDASRATKQPIRDGEKQSCVRLDLGEYVITRKWTKDDAGTLTVESAEGAKYGSPQKMLDEIVGARAFDPLAFTRQSAKDQVTALLELVDLDVDLDKLAADRKQLFDDRTELGRQGKALGEAPAILPGVPDEEQSASVLVGEIREAQNIARANDDARDAASKHLRECKDIEARIADLQEQLSLYKKAHTDAQAVVEQLPTAPDVEALEAELEAVEETNQKVRQNQSARKLTTQRNDLRKQYETITDQIGGLDKQKADALGKAEFPIAGLSFDENGVTFNNIAFSQASAAEQLRVSVALAMAANPKLRVLRILDGSLLDSDSLALIGDLAAENDYQVWIEVVDETGKVGFVIEDGEVRA